MGARGKLRKVCVLASGGLDSAVLIAELLSQGREIHPLYVRCGFVWERVELARLRRLLRGLRHPRLKALAVVQYSMRVPLARHWAVSGAAVPARGAPWDSVGIPGRNLSLFSAAAVLCAARGIPSAAIGVLKGNPFPDASAAFLAKISAAASAGLGFSWRAEAPYRRRSKREIAALARKLGIAASLTLSCMKPRRGRPCARCSKCEELERAL